MSDYERAIADAQYMEANGLAPRYVEAAYAKAEKLRPEIKEQVTRTTPDGKRVVVNVYKDGTTQVLPDLGPDQEKAHFLDTGATIGAVDPFTGKPVAGGGMYQKQQGPDSAASNAVTMRGQNMTDARSREQNAIALTGKQIEQVHTIRKEANSLQDVQNYRQVVPMINSAAKAPNTRAGDLDVIYAVGKALDPGSVVREGELNLVIKSGTLPQQIQGMASYVMGGGKLTPDQRGELVSMLGNRVGQLKEAHDAALAPFLAQARSAGLPEDQLFVKPAEVQVQPKRNAESFDYASVPRGAIYMAPDGSKRVKR
jgi:hypothetical protein